MHLQLPMEGRIYMRDTAFIDTSCSVLPSRFDPKVPLEHLLESTRQSPLKTGGFLLLGLYRTLAWVYDLLPVVQDAGQYLMHRMEHISHPKVYQISHKPHRRYSAHICRNANVWWDWMGSGGGFGGRILMLVFDTVILCLVVFDC